jgi:hypothetical protein
VGSIGGICNQMNVSHNNNWGLLLGYSDGSLNNTHPNSYHATNDAVVGNVQNANLKLITNNIVLNETNIHFRTLSVLLAELKDFNASNGTKLHFINNKTAL